MARKANLSILSLSNKRMPGVIVGKHPTLTRGRRSEAISVTELPAQAAAPILKQYLLKARVGPYFVVTRDSLLEAFELEAPRPPVFHITPVSG